MILLALDTCDSRGSLAILREDNVLQSFAHEDTSDYSSWLLPTAAATLKVAGLQMKDVDVLAVASGPGSFTGVRMGLATIKAWSEAYGKPTAGVSRLEAMALQVFPKQGYVAAFVDAHRDQVFGGLYRQNEDGLVLVEQEMVVAPGGFVNWVTERAAGEAVSWISMDPEKIESLAIWADRARAGETIQQSAKLLAPSVGKLGRHRALHGRLTDALALDAEYVRRCDAELFAKGGASRGT